jgi:hypothetical protein
MYSNIGRLPWNEFREVISATRVLVYRTPENSWNFAQANGKKEETLTGFSLDERLCWPWDRAAGEHGHW